MWIADTTLWDSESLDWVVGQLAKPLTSKGMEGARRNAD